MKRGHCSPGTRDATSAFEPELAQSTSRASEVDGGELVLNKKNEVKLRLWYVLFKDGRDELVVGREMSSNYDEDGFSPL